MLDMAPDRSWLRSVSDYAATLGVTYPRPGFAGPAHVQRSCRWLGGRGGMCTRCALPDTRSAVCPDPWGTISDLLEEFRDLDRATATSDAVLAGLTIGPGRARRALDLLASAVPLNPNVRTSLTTIVTEYAGTAVADSAMVLRDAALDTVTLIQRRAAAGLYLPLLHAASETPTGRLAGSHEPSDAPAGESTDGYALALLPPHGDLTGAAALLLATASTVLEEGGGRLAIVSRPAAKESLLPDAWTALTAAVSLADALAQTQDLAHVLPHVLTLARQTGAPLGDLVDAVRHAHA